MTRQSKPIAADIYDRKEMDAEGQGGSVQDDINDIIDNGGDLDDLFDYFGDEDPIAFL